MRENSLGRGSPFWSQTRSGEGIFSGEKQEGGWEKKKGVVGLGRRKRCLLVRFQSGKISLPQHRLIEKKEGKGIRKGA